MYTVRQLSDLAGVSVRTLHYYDQIGLLRPARVGSNGYRYYDDAGLLRLQQILFYRELGLQLMQIRDALDSPDFDLVTALKSHRRALTGKIDRLRHLIETVDDTIRHLTGEQEMSKKQLFEAFAPEQEKEYTRLARLQYDPALVNQSVRRWNSYSEAQRQAIREEGSRIYTALAAALQDGIPAQSEQVQAIVVRWHNHLHYFYEPTLEILRGLGELYNTSPDFMVRFQGLHPDLPAYLQEAIAWYVDDLETAEIERMLAEDEAQRGQA